MALDDLGGDGWNTSYQSATSTDPGGGWSADPSAPTQDPNQSTPMASAPAPSATPASQPSYTASSPSQQATGGTSTDPAVAQDQQARGVYNDLASAGHDVSWQGNQLMVDGRPYDVTGGGQQGITDPSVNAPAPDPLGGSTSIGAGTPWAAGLQAPTGAPAGYHWDASMANFVADDPSQSQTVRSGQYTGAPTDTNAIKAWIGQLASMPGADPSLANDPDYWATQIIAKGGLTAANSQYWQDAAVGPTAFFNNPNRESGGGGAAAGGAGNYSAPDAYSYQAPTLNTTGLPSSPNLPTVTDPNANWNPSFQTPDVTAPTIAPRVDPTAPWGPGGPTTYAGGTVDTTDIPNFTPDSLLAAEQGTPAAQGLDTLVTNLENSQGPLDQKTLDTIKAQQKDTLAEQAQFQDQNLKGMGGSMGIGDSPWLAAQRAQGMFSRDQSIASSGAAIDVDAAKTNYAARQANAGIGTAYDSAKTAQYMQAVDAGLQRATVTGNREALQASIDQAAAASGQSAQKISADWLQHNVDADTAKELAAAGIKLNYDQLTSANQNHLNDLMVAVQQLKSSTAIQTQTANLNATLQKYGIDVNAALQMNAQQLQKYGIDNNTQLQLAQLKQQKQEFEAQLNQNDKQFGATYGLNAAGLQHTMSNDDWYHSYMDTANL